LPPARRKKPMTPSEAMLARGRRMRSPRKRHQSRRMEPATRKRTPESRKAGSCWEPIRMAVYVDPQKR
jgi:hypothetical protein